MSRRPISKADRNSIKDAVDAIPGFVAPTDDQPSLDSHMNFASHQQARRSHSVGFMLGGIAFIVGIIGIWVLNFSTIVYDMTQSNSQLGLFTDVQDEFEASFAYEPPFFAELEAAIEATQTSTTTTSTPEDAAFFAAFIDAAAAIETDPTVVQSETTTIPLPAGTTTPDLTETDLVF